MKRFNWAVMILGVAFAGFMLSACKDSKSGAAGSPGGSVTPPADADKDGVPDAQDLFPTDPNFGTLAVQLLTGQDIKNKVNATTSKGDFAVAQDGSLGVGRWDKASLVKMVEGSTAGLLLPYVDRDKLDAACPNRAQAGDTCDNALVLLNDVVFADSRMDLTITQPDPKLWWAILFRANGDGSDGYSLEFNTAAHRWSNAEWFPYGMYSLSDIKTGILVGKVLKAMPTSSTHIVSIEAIGDHISVYEGTDRQLLFSVDDSLHASGSVGFSTWMGSSMKVNSLSVANKIVPPAAPH